MNQSDLYGCDANGTAYASARAMTGNAVRSFLAVGGFLCAAQWSHAQALARDASIDSIVATESHVSGALSISNVQTAVEYLERVFSVPICYESDQTRNLELFERSAQTLELSVDKGETLGMTLDRFCAETNGAYRWDTIQGSVCLFPAPLRDDTKANALENSISLDAKDCSTWDAFKLIARQFNLTFLESGRLAPLSVEPVGLGIGVKPLDAFTDTIIGDIALNNATARDVICAVIQTSPIKLKYSSFQTRLGDTKLSVYMYLEDGTAIGKENRPQTTYEESQWWANEVWESTRYAAAFRRLNVSARPD
jgi:hypothetical protein